MLVYTVLRFVDCSLDYEGDAYSCDELGVFRSKEGAKKCIIDDLKRDPIDVLREDGLFEEHQRMISESVADSIANLLNGDELEDWIEKVFTTNIWYDSNYNGREMVTFSYDYSHPNWDESSVRYVCTEHILK